MANLAREERSLELTFKTEISKSSGDALHSQSCIHVVEKLIKVNCKSRSQSAVLGVNQKKYLFQLRNSSRLDQLFIYITDTNIGSQSKGDCGKVSFSQAIVRRGPFNCKTYLELKKVKVNFNRTGRVSHLLQNNIQPTPDNSYPQGKSKKVRVIGSSKKIAGRKEDSKFYVSDASTLLFFPDFLRAIEGYRG